MNQAEAIGLCHRTCSWCSGGSVDAFNQGLWCARYGPEFHCAVMDLERAVHLENRQEVRDVLTESNVRPWAGVRGLPEHDAVTEILKAAAPEATARGEVPAKKRRGK